MTTTRRAQERPTATTLAGTTPEPFTATRDARQVRERPIGSKCGSDCARPTPAQAHCSVCHTTFGGVSGFDAHRRDGVCADPASLGMECRGEVWRTPMSEAGVERFRALREAS